MNYNEVAFLKDLIAFIEWGMKNDKSFGWVVANCGHDIFGVLADYNDTFSSRTKGYGKINANENTKKDVAGS